MKVAGLKIVRNRGTLFVRYEGTPLTRKVGRQTLCRMGRHNTRGWVLNRANVVYCTRCVTFDEALEAAVQPRGHVVLPIKEEA